MYITRWRVLTHQPHDSLTFLVTIQCPVCRQTSEIVAEEYSKIWRWGLDRDIPQHLIVLLRQQRSHHGDIELRMMECTHCGSPSAPSIDSVKWLERRLLTAVGHLHEGIGAPWAREPLEKKMIEHLQDTSASGNPSSYYFNASGHKNEFLLRYCPCERCDKDRVGHLRIKQLEPRHFDLEDYRSKLPKVVPAGFYCSP